ncbi:MAG: hypothetical protein CMC74_12490 [Flavobacteriaceae bacterium]|nr:hypothetical protein [Flavobacteriaceae bacterium]
MRKKSRLVAFFSFFRIFKVVLTIFLQYTGNFLKNWSNYYPTPELLLTLTFQLFLFPKNITFVL